jgi:transcriptional regulator with GAF, ATPase, and Fis domain
MKLLATSGPQLGEVLTLVDGLTLSASPTSGPSVHFFSSPPSFVLETLDADVAVFVNGLPVTSRTLEVRDELQIGESQFVVRSDEATPGAGPGPCPVAQHTFSSTIRLELGFDDALLPAAGSVEVGADTPARASHDFSALLRAAAALSSVRGLAQFDAAIASLILDAIPAGAVALHGDAGMPTLFRSAWTLSPKSDPMRIDPDLIDRAARERKAFVIDSDGATDDAAGIHSIAAPMTAFGRVVGSMWLEGRPATPFDEGHLRLLMVLGAIAAVAREQWRESLRLEEHNEQLRAEINLEHNMVGTSKPMRTLFDRIARVARTDSTILLRGESGTGKELVARAAHRNSSRADKPFIAINCAALTETLLESELFGHEKGAFTGAIGLKRGKMELAEGGTLFLDEIGELPLTLQAKLLRALQEREFERVGGTRPVRVDFRLIAATNRDLDAASRAGTFRQDLFYRLNVVSLVLPPLRERREDIPFLADYFVRKHAPRSGRRVDGFEPDALRKLELHDWPGNVRELENAIEQALALGVSNQITAEDLPAHLAQPAMAAGVGSLDYHATVEGTKRELILRAFERADQNHAAAAKLLGVHPNYLHRLLNNFELRRGR